MKEWYNPYNAFNSYKGLLYRNEFDAIIKGKFLPPVQVSLDLTNNCQLNCIWCNGKNIINHKHSYIMKEHHLIELIDFCKTWGVKSICFAGGGESTLHDKLPEALDRAYANGIESSVITNGVFISDKLLKSITKTRWTAISVDSSTSKTYLKCKGSDKFYDVINNIKKLVALNMEEITYKYLIHPYNQYEIYDACKIALDIGCKTFHSRILSTKYTDLEFDYDKINEQLEKCHELQINNFDVFTIRHKQVDKNNRRIRFNKCKASPLNCVFTADGIVSICPDRRGDKRTFLCRHDNPNDILKVWGSDKHKKLLNKICPDKDCPKCTITIYQELLNAYEQDKFCKNFP